MDHILLMYLVAALVMRLGLGLYAIGGVRSKNAAATGFRALLNLCLAALAFWAIGGAIASFSGNQVLGIRLWAIVGWNKDISHSILFLAPALIASGVLTGPLAERSRTVSLLAMPILVAGILVPIALFWTHTGWLRNIGFVDTAGSSVIHVTGGIAALVASILIGPREGKFNRDGSSNAIPGHSLPLMSAGVLTIWVGWVPFVQASASIEQGLSFVPTYNALIAPAAAGLVSYFYAQWRFGKPDIAMSFAAILGGLVAISAGAGVVSSLAAFTIGAVCGIVVPLAIIALDVRFRIDDPNAAISTHAVAGLWGTLAVGVFAPGTIAQKLSRLGTQALGATAILLLALLLTSILLLILRSFTRLRVSEAIEYDGLDLGEHDINAYPDFQQTMIKSYHLREA